MRFYLNCIEMFVWTFYFTEHRTYVSQKFHNISLMLYIEKVEIHIVWRDI